MGSKIKAWEIIEGQPQPVESTLADEGRTETLDLEEWLASDPSIIRPGLQLIGRQVSTRSGRLDLLAIDRAGNLVIIELKREKLPREALTQAIDYAADIASWGVDRIGEVCAQHTGEELEDVLTEAFSVDFDGLSINKTQRVVLVGFSVDSSLERMIEWLSEGYGVDINAVVLKYVNTSTGSEVLTRSAVISEQLEAERRNANKIPTSDEPGDHEDDQLQTLLRKYFSQDNMISVERIRDVLLPACIEQDFVTRDDLKRKLVDRGAAANLSKAGLMLTSISNQLGMQKNDFLRQVVGYKYPNNPWEKDNYFLREEYRDLVHQVLEEIETDGRSTESNAA